ncbi:recombinase family protein [Paenibacillus alvei]|uniref:Recombinase family protein n=1 Tax=Paenibacillus alvei TaxID=44250 RepID=A0ABT4H1W1_PAEAL|nr:recombinase family protein [Paenibacillus alvei]EJW14267.1 putative DNA recombinase CisA [Paenibacillus alvei DSM 29]MCY9545057.1 recombinase family protein [Paenibacillus alvei]MCY9738260.1 recombinase family protein [Paenibacillus alvei]MCY9762636.1 recombinase family protein [Paenibacillus alvei]MCY9769650.1 recombinase family protein [Paenibacillus alvei]
MRVAAYIRVSTDEQADKGNSLSEQQERLILYCKGMLWNEPVMYIDDGYSAKDLKRPAIQRLLNDVRQNKYDVVVTSKLDRFCRNLLDLLQSIKLLEQHDCSFVSASERLDTTSGPVGKMVMQQLGSFAEFERARISERVKDNMLPLAKKTSKALTRPCYGLDVVNGYYEINKSEAEFANLMFDLGEDGYGHRKIAQILNERGSRTKKGYLWDQTSVKRLMQNPALAGMKIYNKRMNRDGKTVIRPMSEWVIRENNHPAVIQLERFLRVNEIMKYRSKAHKHADSETYLLTGVLKCRHCGRNMKGSTSRHKTKYGKYTYYRYICASYVSGYGCFYHAVHRDDIENLIIKEIQMLGQKSNAEIKVASPKNQHDKVRDLENQLAKISKKMQKQIEAYENELISAEDLKLARQRVESEREDISTRLSKLKEEKPNSQNIVKHANNLMNDITGIDRIKAKNAIRSLIAQIEIENGESISITWNSCV